jgi:predicted nucleic acid-binding protein
MTTNPKKVYWDSSCFICFLNPDESDRRAICEDVLRHAELGELEIWISTWVIVEVIRPRKPGKAPLPKWGIEAIKAVAEADKPLRELWERYQRSAPTPKLSEAQIRKIQGMFDWPFLKKIYVDERVAQKAVEFCRDYGFKPGDAVHAASAVLSKCASLQNWDKDFSKIKHLITVEEPDRISPQAGLFDAAKQKDTSQKDPTSKDDDGGAGEEE